jgi:H+/Cl- antiporter ClcA
MGAGIAAGFLKYFKTDPRTAHMFILCGIACGFGAVFGTPIAAAVFALEFTRHPIISPKIILCLFTALIGDHVCHAWGAIHTAYPTIRIHLGFWKFISLIWQCLLLCVIIALVAKCFVFLSSYTSKKFREWFPHEALRGTVGGLLIIALFLFVGTSDYLGLGVLAQHPDSLTLTKSFSPEIRASGDAWLWKLVFTIITIAAGFKGGEVTPIFFIGAALGNAVAWHIGAPVSLFAGLAMITLFATTTKTPYASLIMGIELLGWQIFVPLVLIIWFTMKLSGKSSIYHLPTKSSSSEKAQ